MPRYIPYKQIQQLREAAKGGDERAKRILRCQLEDGDFSADLEDYFKPVEEKPVEEVAEAPVEEVKQEQPDQAAPEVKDISQSIMALISLCDQKTLEIVGDPDMTEATKKGAIAILGEIKQSCLDNLDKFGKLMKSLKPKEEVVEEQL